MVLNYITNLSLNDLGDFSRDLFHTYMQYRNVALLIKPRIFYIKQNSFNTKLPGILYLFLIGELFILQLFTLEGIHWRNLLGLMYLIMLSCIYSNSWHVHYIVSIHACVQK